MPYPGLSLLGFIKNEQEALNYLRSSCMLTKVPDATLLGFWRTARQTLTPFTQRAGTPNIRDIPDEYCPYLEGVQSNPRFEYTCMRGERKLTWSFKLVEIEPILAWQVHIRKDRMNEVTASVDRPLTVQQMLGICLPHQVGAVNFTTTPMPAKQPRSGSVVVRSDDLNCRPHEVGLIWSPDDQLTVAGVGVGAATPLVQVVQFNGKYILHNGYHRACGLAAAGATHIPCLLLEGQIYEDAALVQSVLPRDLVLSSAPPMLGHFTRGQAHAVKLRRFKREITISYHYDERVTPAE